MQYHSRLLKITFSPWLGPIRLLLGLVQANQLKILHFFQDSQLGPETRLIISN